MKLHPIYVCVYVGDGREKRRTREIKDNLSDKKDVYTKRS
jgi:hypothetical protein